MNPIYSTLVALATGVVATKFCRPDLKSVMVRAALLMSASSVLVVVNALTLKRVKLN